jgi:hypothetical protein
VQIKKIILEIKETCLENYVFKRIMEKETFKSNLFCLENTLSSDFIGSIILQHKLIVIFEKKNLTDF